MALLEPQENLFIYMVKFSASIDLLEEQGGVECGEYGLAANLRAARHIQHRDVREKLWDERERLVRDSPAADHKRFYPHKGLWGSMLDVIKLKLTIQNVEMSERMN